MTYHLTNVCRPLSWGPEHRYGANSGLPGMVLYGLVLRSPALSQPGMGPHLSSLLVTFCSLTNFRCLSSPCLRSSFKLVSPLDLVALPTFVGAMPRVIIACSLQGIPPLPPCHNLGNRSPQRSQQRTPKITRKKSRR